MKYKRLETDRLILRNFSSEDLDFIYRHFSDSYVSKYLYDNEPPKNLNEAHEILDWCINGGSDHIRWCIEFKEISESIGTIGFHRYDRQNNSAEIGYDLQEEYSQKGIMTEALQCVMEYGFTEFALHRVSASIALENSASNGLLEKCGFSLEGVIRDQYFFRGQYYDHNLWSYIFSPRTTGG